jgi:hypothetical protein
MGFKIVKNNTLLPRFIIEVSCHPIDKPEGVDLFYSDKVGC